LQDLILSNDAPPKHQEKKGGRTMMNQIGKEKKIQKQAKK
jgi:hypothetical protein